MNYIRIHDEIINNAIDRCWNKPSDADEYVERHHILPKSLGGSNELDNLVYLTGREHYLIHWLLYKIHKTGSMASAWHSFNMTKNNPNGRYTSHTFSYARKAKSLSMIGVKRDPSIGRKVSIAQKGKVISEEQRRNHSIKMKGRKLSSEHRSNISLGLLGGTRTEDQKTRMSEAAPKTAVLRVLDNGDTVRYNSVKEASGGCNLKRIGISKCITGYRKSYKGTFWRYADED